MENVWIQISKQRDKTCNSTLFFSPTMSAFNFYFQTSVASVLEFTLGGVSSGIASTVTNPLSVVRVRIQNQVSGENAYKGMISGIRKIWLEEGMPGMCRGLHASWVREISHSSIRFGLYDPLRYTISRDDSKHASVSAKFTSAFISGCIGSALTNPADFIKTRQQMAIIPSNPLFFASNFQRHCAEVRSIWKESGLSGFWRGWSATMFRSAMLTSFQIGSYDTVKNDLCVDTLSLREGPALQLTAAMISSVITTTASNPFDIIKTKYMCSDAASYNGVLDCTLQNVRRDGPMIFMKGWIPAYWKIAPHHVITLILVEKFRSVLGMQTL